MKVILTGDVKPLGSRGAVVDVKDGYANNFLFPQKLAVVATPGAMKQLEQAVIRVAAKAGGNGRLFGTVTNAQVADALHEQLGIAIDRHKIEMKDGIKALGTYPVEIRLGNNILAKSAVQVVALK